MTKQCMSERRLTGRNDCAALDRRRLAARPALDRESDRERDDGKGRPPRVLQVMVVADEQDTPGGLAARVRRWGHDAHAVRDRASALQCAAATQLDVVLLDIEWTNFSGRQEVRPFWRKLARADGLIVALTRHAGRGHRRRCRQAGIDLVLVDPVDPAVLQTLLLLECMRVNRVPTHRAPAREDGPKSFDPTQGV